ncbi:hypothetical protein [Lentibacter sp. XHP0401]|uniref:hypothetical protein n=1 Tax=Lentibacter sp. XHP0401 TaxID=2984334 RepID=UPI0021E93C54|nr:hypothetical protein [Lentibacter sp. XHP0401]MCV2892688.1 hypothetical protein [Lentibacter sp. XHP0401]
MKNIIPITAALALLSSPLHAADCFADYKAKQDNPLKLHYGVAQVSGPCNAAAARAELAPRLAKGGWVLLNVVSVFDASGLNGRKASAGPFYLRF